MITKRLELKQNKALLLNSTEMACISLQPDAFKSYLISVSHLHGKMWGVLLPGPSGEDLSGLQLLPSLQLPPSWPAARGDARAWQEQMYVFTYIWHCRRPTSRAVWGLHLQGEALHCGKLRKITAKCLKIPLCLFLSQSSGGPDGLGVGV